MKKITITAFLKQAAILTLACSFSFLTHAEKRYYFTRGGDLPVEAGLTTVDLRSGQNGVSIAPNQMTLDASYEYTYYTKAGAGWFSFNQSTSSSIDMSDVNTDFNDWYLKLKVKTGIASTSGSQPEINVILNGIGATANAFQLAETDLPRDGKWYELSLKLTDYKSAIDLQNSFSSTKSGMLFQMHGENSMSAGYLAIDYAYLTNDPTETDAGSSTATNSTRYYLLKNKQTPTTGSFDMIDFTGDVNPNAAVTAGWNTPDYATYPYYTIDGTETAVSVDFGATTDNIELIGADDSWYLKTMIRTTTSGDIKFTLFDCNDDEYVYTVPVGNNTGEWIALDILLSDFTGTGTPQYDCQRNANDELFRIEVENGAADDIFHLAYLYITNEDASVAADPEPADPIDPSKERRIYFVNDGSDLPAGDIISTDYRIGKSSNVKLNIAQENGWQNTLNWDQSYDYLYFTTIETWWYSVDIQPSGAGVDLSDVTSDWYLNLKIKSESTSRPINPFLYPEQGQAGTGLITADMLTVGEWAEIQIPLSEYGENLSFGNYTSGNIFSLNAGHDNTSGKIVAIEYMYLTNVKKDDGPSLTIAHSQLGNIRTYCEGNNLFVDNLNGASYIRIIDLNGKTVSQVETTGSFFQTTLNLPKGMYLVEVTSGNSPKQIVKIVL